MFNRLFAILCLCVPLEGAGPRQNHRFHARQWHASRGDRGPPRARGRTYGVV